MCGTRGPVLAGLVWFGAQAEGLERQELGRENKGPQPPAYPSGPRLTLCFVNMWCSILASVST